MKSKELTAIHGRPLQTNLLPQKNLILTEEELINVDPRFENLTPEEKTATITFAYEMSLALYNFVSKIEPKVSEA